MWLLVKYVVPRMVAAKWTLIPLATSRASPSSTPSRVLNRNPFAKA